MNDDVEIRSERPDDYDEIAHLVREAFWNVYQPGCVEHYIVHEMRQDPAFIPSLAFVATLKGKLVGHIVYAKSHIVTKGGLHIATIMFGPISVHPEYQGRGIGSELIHHSLKEAARLGHQLVCITGDPAYYSRFGFIRASDKGIHMREIDPQDPAPYFMIKPLTSLNLESYRGMHVEPDVYHADDDKVAAYDRRFPPKTKEKRPGQLK